MNEILVDELARITYKFKKEENVECIYLLPAKSESENCYSMMVNLIVKSNNNNKHLLNSVLNYNISKEKEEFENKSNTKISITTDLACCYNNIFDKKNSLMQKSAENDLFNATILYDKSGKYYRLKKQIDLRYKKLKLSWLFKYEDSINMDLPLYNKYK